eukprot:3655907-Amphidinium_carterae.1
MTMGEVMLLGIAHKDECLYDCCMMTQEMQRQGYMGGISGGLDYHPTESNREEAVCGSILIRETNRYTYTLSNCYEYTERVLRGQDQLMVNQPPQGMLTMKDLGHRCRLTIQELQTRRDSAQARTLGFADTAQMQGGCIPVGGLSMCGSPPRIVATTEEASIKIHRKSNQSHIGLANILARLLKNRMSHCVNK